MRHRRHCRAAGAPAMPAAAPGPGRPGPGGRAGRRRRRRRRAWALGRAVLAAGLAAAAGGPRGAGAQPPGAAGGGGGAGLPEGWWAGPEVRRRLLGHQSANRGAGLAESARDPALGYVVYQRNAYFDGKYPFNFPSLVGAGKNSPLGGDWDMSYVEPLPDSLMAGPVSGVEELFERQRGAVVVGIVENLLAKLHADFCVGRRDRLIPCPAFKTIRDKFFVNLGARLCGIDPGEVAGPFEHMPVQEQLVQLLGKCDADLAGTDLEREVKGVIRTILAETGLAKPNIVSILDSNAMNQAGLRSLAATTAELLRRQAQGLPAPAMDRTPYQRAWMQEAEDAAFGEWSRQRLEPTVHTLADYTAEVERGAHAKCTFSYYLQHPSRHAAVERRYSGADTWGWSVHDRKWCNLDHHRFCVDRYPKVADSNPNVPPWKGFLWAQDGPPKPPFIFPCTLEECIANGGACPRYGGGGGGPTA